MASGPVEPTPLDGIKVVKSGTEGGREYVGDFLPRNSQARVMLLTLTPRELDAAEARVQREGDQTDDGGSAIVRACSPGERMKMQKSIDDIVGVLEVDIPAVLSISLLLLKQEQADVGD